jgi:hypothetical protein
MAELGAHTGKELPQPELIERQPREIPALTSDSPP